MKNPRGAIKSCYRITRGGWLRQVHAARRSLYPPGDIDFRLGFRIVTIAT